MLTYVLTPLATFVFVFIKSFQYRNVAFERYAAIIPTSMVFAFAEYYVIYSVVTRGFYDPKLIALVGLAGGLGSLSATFVHKRFYQHFDNKKEKQ